MTRMLSMLHRWVNSPQHITTILADVVRISGRRQILDLCSGDGGLMTEVHKRLLEMEDIHDVSLVLTDLYPNAQAREKVMAEGGELLQYREESVDATCFRDTSGQLIRTLICGFHHMRPEQAKAILVQAMKVGDPILIYEISDNSFPPKHLWWLGLPLNLMFAIAVAALVRPMTLTHFFLSFVVPIVPICFAWDGAVSNARTYTRSDLNELLSETAGQDYVWTIRTIDAMPAKHICLIGMPKAAMI